MKIFSKIFLFFFFLFFQNSSRKNLKKNLQASSTSEEEEKDPKRRRLSPGVQSGNSDNQRPGVNGADKEKAEEEKKENISSDCVVVEELSTVDEGIGTKADSDVVDLTDDVEVSF